MSMQIVLNFHRIASGDYSADLGDGRRVDIYRIPDLNPAAWNAHLVDGDSDDLIVDGAASYRDARALAQDAINNL